MARTIEPGDLGMVDPAEIDRDSVKVGFDPPPTHGRSRRERRPSKWVAYVVMADERASKETQVEVIRGKEATVGPWITYPESEQAIVRANVARDLVKAFGPKSGYPAENNGAYFEIILRDTIKVMSSTGNSLNTMGVLWVRKVMPKAVAE